MLKKARLICCASNNMLLVVLLLQSSRYLAIQRLSLRPKNSRILARVLLSIRVVGGGPNGSYLAVLVNWYGGKTAERQGGRRQAILNTGTQNVQAYPAA